MHFVPGICGAHGGHKTAEVRDVQRTGGGCGLRGGAGKRVDLDVAREWEGLSEYSRSSRRMRDEIRHVD